jgi:hypothetical protein
MPDPVSPQAPQFLLDMVRRTLTPIVRLLLHFGISYPVCAELLKRVFVQTAEREFTLADREQTASRLALLTGIHRQEINRLRETLAAENEAPIEKTSTAAALSPRLLTAWTQSARFTDAAGAPLLLYRSTVLGEPSFEELVASVSKDIRPRAVLDEWLRLGIVSITEAGLLQLNVEVFVPNASLPAKAEVIGNILHDHISASVHNLRGVGEPFYDRRVRVDGLTPEALVELRAEFRRRGEVFMRELTALADRAAAGEAEGPTHRMSIGLFEFDEREQHATKPLDDR